MDYVLKDFLSSECAAVQTSYVAVISHMEAHPLDMENACLLLAVRPKFEQSAATLFDQYEPNSAERLQVDHLRRPMNTVISVAEMFYKCAGEVAEAPTLQDTAGHQRALPKTPSPTEPLSGFR